MVNSYADFKHRQEICRPGPAVGPIFELGRLAAPPFVQASIQNVPAQTSVGVCGDAASALLPDGIE